MVTRPNQTVIVDGMGPPLPPPLPFYLPQLEECPHTPEGMWDSRRMREIVRALGLRD